MRNFSNLYATLDATTRTNDKIAAMRGYFDAASPADAAWAVYFLSGRRPKRLLSPLLLRRWAAELAGVPEWLQEEAYHAVGDSAEAAALLLPDASQAADRPLSAWVEGVILPLREKDEAAQRAAVLAAWDQLDDPGRYVFNKLLTGGFRVGVSQRLLMRALADAAGLPQATIAQRLMGAWEPTPAFYAALVAPDTPGEPDADGALATDPGRPYPFFLAYPLESDPATLGDVAEWQAEWKWDGIRAQLIRRGGQTFLWSRGEELVTDRYPEVVAAAEALPDCVLDGELLAWEFAAGRPQPFAALQQRIGRKNLSRKLLDETPVVLLVYDLLEWQGEDWRQRPLAERRAQLEALLAATASEWLPISTVVTADSWDALASLREESRGRGVEGLMLKRLSSPYRVGRRRGDWWKWKIDPYTIDAVLIYAQRGSGRRAGLYTDYTFALWRDGEDGRELVPFAKAYSGLTDAEIAEVDRFVRANTEDRFGPVRAVRPELVMEMAFESIQASTRHKSGVAVRFPRILRWRRDKGIDDADALETLRAMIAA
ncbi:MAG: ATP-dependent DNA ligase [Candidatus Promineofilum sp.]|nr:ATP-dependent DNA ligase [Promineifilum sp.]